jgi:hypothetical protein
MRLYSNIRMSVIDRIHSWKSIHPNVYTVQNVYDDIKTISLQKPHFYASLPFDLRAKYMWEYPDKQVPTPMDLQAWNLNHDGFYYDNAIFLPADVQKGDMIYCNFTELY